MSGFVASAVERLSYDFTGVPRDDGQARCVGKGFIPEPSKAKLEAFFSDFQELSAAAQAQMTGAEPVDGEEPATSDDLEARTYQMVSDLCSGKPTVDELRQLPPRIFQAFNSYLLEKLGPKA